MDKKLAGLLGAAAALATMTQAVPAQATDSGQVANYRDLLDPIPNALPQLKADDARLAQKPAPAGTQLAEVSVRLGHHHHHHARHHHHHHHHHARHHHHHHHHH